ncbi:MAG: hypothetical protein AAF907_17750, partial [Planctomycetota bacterium]
MYPSLPYRGGPCGRLLFAIAACGLLPSSASAGLAGVASFSACPAPACQPAACFTSFRPVTETCYRTVMRPVCEAVPVTCNRTIYETVCEDQTRTVMRTVTETACREEQYTVMRPVFETSSREERFTVMR